MDCVTSFLSRMLADALRDKAAAVEHVGSTSVPGLAANPLIDMGVVEKSEATLLWAADRLAALGCVHRGNLGVAEREAFHAPANDPAHHVYLCPPGSSEFQRHMAFRDCLRARPENAKAYSELKLAPAERFRKDPKPYQDAKAGSSQSFPAERLRHRTESPFFDFVCGPRRGCDNLLASF